MLIKLTQETNDWWLFLHGVAGRVQERCCVSLSENTNRIIFLEPNELKNAEFLTHDCYAKRAYDIACRVSVCLSVFLPVTFRYCDHIGWNTSKIISQPNSLRSLLKVTPTWAVWCNGNPNTPKIRVKYGCGQELIRAGISPKRCKIGPKLLLRTNKKLHKRFRLVTKSMSL